MGCPVARIGLFHKNNSFAEAKSLVLQLPVPHTRRTAAEVFLAEGFEQDGKRSGGRGATSVASRCARQESYATARAPKFFLVHRYLDRCGVAEAARSSRDRERVSTRRSYRRYGEGGCLGRAGIGRGDRGRSGGGHGAGVYREGRAGSAGSDGHVGRHRSHPVVTGEQYLCAASRSCPAERYRAGRGRPTIHAGWVER